MKSFLLSPVLGCLLLAGCVYPVAVSPDRRAKIDACLEKCPAEERSREAVPHEQGNLTDHRSACERNCHSR